MTEEERIELLPEPLRTQAKKLLSIRPEELPEVPEKGKWYVYRPEGCVCSTGTPYMSTLRIGKENKLMVVFCGGGCAVDAHAAARPGKTGEAGESFYFSDTFLVGYFEGHAALADCNRAENPFKDWSIVVVSYATGDFHTGKNDFYYDDPELGKGVCCHHGYFNYRAMAEKMKEFVPSPEKLLITGYSGGGFAASLLADDVLSLFPDCKDVTCYNDSGVLSSAHWQETMRGQWNAPEEIAERIKSDILPLDSLLCLHEKYGERVKIALSCSFRDAMLSQYEGYLHGEKGLYFSRKNGDAFQRTLKRAVETLIKCVPNVSVYIFDRPSSEAGVKQEDGLTEHTFWLYDYFYGYSFGGVSALDWVKDTVEGRPQKVGLSLLGIKE